MAQVLVVDDSAMVRSSVADFLNANGIEAITAEDGRDGLNRFSQARQQLRLIICDVNMPNMDGLTMVEQLRSEHDAQLPVIMLTTEADPRLKARGKAAGVKGWIVKPFDGPAVLGAIRKMIG